MSTAVMTTSCRGMPHVADTVGLKRLSRILNSVLFRVPLTMTVTLVSEAW